MVLARLSHLDRAALRDLLTSRGGWRWTRYGGPHGARAIAIGPGDGVSAYLLDEQGINDLAAPPLATAVPDDDGHIVFDESSLPAAGPVFILALRTVPHIRFNPEFQCRHTRCYVFAKLFDVGASFKMNVVARSSKKFSGQG